MRLFPLLLLVASTSCALAASFTPESAATYALAHNKDLAAARYAIAEAEGRLLQAGLWRNPEFNSRAETSVRRSDGDRRFEAEFMQRFPWSGRLEKAKNVARVDVAMAVAELRDKERLLAGDVLGKARQILILDRRIAVNGANRDLAERIVKQATALSASGQTTASEVRVAELEVATLDIAQQTFTTDRRARLVELNGLLGRAPADALEITGELPKTPASTRVEAVTRNAVARRPDRQLAVLQSDKARAEGLLARAERWEDIGVGFGMTRERQESMYDTMMGLSLSVPLPLWNRNQGRLAENRAIQGRTQAALESLDLAIATGAAEARSRMQGLAEVLQKTRGTALELARRNTKVLEETYASGSASFQTVLESRRQHLRVEQAAIDAQQALVNAITDWQTRTADFGAAVHGPR